MNNKQQQNPILIYLHECGIEPYLRTLAVLADAGRCKNQDVYLTLCACDLPHCNMMEMHGIDYKNIEKAKKNLCTICHKKCLEACDEYGFIPLNLKKYSDDIVNEVEKLQQHEQTNLLQLEHRGFAVGIFSAYEFSLSTKYIYSDNCSQEHKELLLTYINNTIFSLECAQRIYEELSPQQALIFNEHAFTVAVKHIGKNHGGQIIASSVLHHCGVSGSQFLLCSEYSSVTRLKHLQRWKDYKQYPVSQQRVIQSFDDTLFRSYDNCSHLFSPNKQDKLNILAQNLNLQLQKKICVVYTSSLDERYGFESVLLASGHHPGSDEAFSSQIEWLHALQEHVKKRDDVQVVVRVHPREGTKKRPKQAEHLFALQKEFSQCSKNFIMVWPDDPVSSYDLLEFADLVLIAWSSMGMEAARIGIPVLAWAGNINYINSDSIRLATTSSTYFTAFDEILSQDATFAQLREGVRYNTWCKFIQALDMSETVDDDFFKISSWPRASSECKSVIQDIFEGKIISPTEYNITQWMNSLDNTSEEEEKNTILKCIEAFIHTTFCPPPPERKVTFWFRVQRKIYKLLTNKIISTRTPISSAASYSSLQLEFCSENLTEKECLKKTLRNNSLRLITIDGINVTYFANGEKFHRKSKLIARLANYLKT